MKNLFGKCSLIGVLVICAPAFVGCVDGGSAPNELPLVEPEVVPGDNCGLMDPCSDPAQVTFSTFEDFSISPPLYPAKLTSDGTSLYAGGFAVFKLDLTNRTKTLIAGNELSVGFANGIGTAARFAFIRGLAYLGGSLLVADEFNHVIRRVNMSNNSATVLTGKVGTEGSKDTDLVAPAEFNSPQSVLVVSDLAFVADFKNATIRMIDGLGGQTSTFAGSANERGIVDGVGSAARFQYPRSLAYADEHIYVTDYLSHAIRRINVLTKRVTTYAGSNTEPGFANGRIGTARFRSPSELATDGTNLYVFDAGNKALRKIHLPTGVVSTIKRGSGSQADGPGTAASLGAVTSMVFLNNAIYFAEGTPSVLRVVR